MPKSWTDDPKRCDRAGVPPDVEFATRTQLGAELIEQALHNQVSRAPILADAMYGDSAEFRARLRKQQLEYFLQVTPGEHKGWREPVKSRLKQVHYHVDKGTPPSQTLVELAAQIHKREWGKCEWTSASGHTRTTRLAWCELYLQADLHQGGIEEHWLVVDWPEADPEPYRYYIAHLHEPPSRARCLRLSRSRWQIEQFFQRAKTDLGLDHFEGRSWRGSR